MPILSAPALPTSLPPSGAAGGDLTGTFPNPTLAAIIAAAGPTGSATVVPIVTVDAKGRITALTSTTITGVAPAGAAGGQLAGTYPNPTLVTTALPGHVFASASATTSVAVTSTNQAAQTLVLAAGAFTFDGATAINVEFYAPYMDTPPVNNVPLILGLLDGNTTVVGNICRFYPNTGQQGNNAPCYFKTFTFTPAAGSHNYGIGGYVTSGTGHVNAGSGSSSTDAPMEIRVVKAG